MFTGTMYVHKHGATKLIINLTGFYNCFDYLTSNYYINNSYRSIAHRKPVQNKTVIQIRVHSGKKKIVPINGLYFSQQIHLKNVRSINLSKINGSVFHQTKVIESSKPHFISSKIIWQYHAAIHRFFCASNESSKQQGAH